MIKIGILPIMKGFDHLAFQASFSWIHSHRLHEVKTAEMTNVELANW